MPLAFIKDIQKCVIKNAPTILTVMGGRGTVASVFLAVDSTLKAQKMIEEHDEELSKADKALLYIEAYSPTAIMTAASLIAIFGANYVNRQRIAAIASAYILSESNFEEYKEKVQEMFGKKKAEQVQGNIVQDHIDDNPKRMDNVHISPYEPGASMLWFDETCHRYFYSSGERIRRVELEANKILAKDGWISLNDVYDMLGLPGVKIGYDLGWQKDLNREVEFDIGGALTEGDVPCGTISMDPRPSSWWFSETS